MAACTRRTFFTGLAFMLPALFFLDFSPAWGALRKPVNLCNFLYLGLGASALCFATWNRAVKILGAVRTSVYIYLVPVVTVITAVLILHERITLPGVMRHGARPSRPHPLRNPPENTMTARIDACRRDP